MELEDFKRGDGYFDVELSDREVNACSYIYNKILELIPDDSLNDVGYTLMQKVAVEVINECNLDFITHGTLHFGKVTALPPGNTKENVNFNDTEIGSFVSEEACIDSIKENLLQFDLKDKESIAKLQHRLHKDDFYILCDEFLTAIEGDHSKKEIIGILEEMKENFPKTSLLEEEAEERFNYFIAIAEEIIWKKNRYDVSEDLASVFEDIQKLIGNCRFHDTVVGDSAEEMKEATEKKCNDLKKKVDDSLNDLADKLKFYIKMDKRRTKISA